MHAPDKNDITYIEERYGKIAGWIPGAIDQKTGKINPQVTQAYLGGNTFASVFHVKPIYYETYAGEWRPLSEVTVWHGNHKIEFNKDWWKVHPRYMAWLEKRMQLINGQLLIPSLFQDVVSPYSGVIRELHQSLVPLKLGLTTSTFYPDPDTETTTVDGYVARDAQIESWSTCRTTATGTGANSNGTVIQTYVGDGQSPDYKWIYRSAFLFDTSAIGDSDTIDSGEYSIYISTTSYDEDIGAATKYISLTSVTLASNTEITTSDYNYTNWGTTKFGTDINVATFVATPNQYYSWVLNSSGLSNISKTGVSKFALRHGCDITDTAPSAVGNKYNGLFSGRSADYSGTTYDPKLVVVHTAGASTFIPRVSFIM